MPACAIDAYVEFRHLMNDGAVKAADREKGFFSLDGALRYFCEDLLQFKSDKEDSRGRILQGPPFSHSERRELLDYCEEDVRKLVLLAPHLIPTIRSLPHAMFRAGFQWPIAQYQHRGIPTNYPEGPAIPSALGRHTARSRHRAG